jgi:hypothetical protein
MKRADAIEVIEKAGADRLTRMFNMLADAFEGSRTEKDQARANFERGLPMLAEAKANAIDMVTKATDAFPE